MTDGVEAAQHVRIGVPEIAQLAEVDPGLGEDATKVLLLEDSVIALEGQQLLVAAEVAVTAASAEKVRAVR